MNYANESQKLAKKFALKGKKLRFKSARSIIEQYIKGNIPAKDTSSESKRRRIETTSQSRVPATQNNPKSIIFQRCNAPLPAPKFYQKNIEICAPDILCLNLTAQESESSPEKVAKPDMPISSTSTRDRKSVLMMELDELKKISTENENQIGKLITKLNKLKLSVSLLSEEQQRLEHSREIRTIGLKLFNNMLKNRKNLDGGGVGGKEATNNEKYQQYEREKQIIEKILEQLARLEKVKMKLEYENIRNLYTIRELKKENAELEKMEADLLKELNSRGS